MKNLSNLSKFTQKAIELLDEADLNNPNTLSRDSAEKELVEMKVVDEDGNIIESEQNKELNEWWELNRC